jgi:hypothetical protein
VQRATVRISAPLAPENTPFEKILTFNGQKNISDLYFLGFSGKGIAPDRPSRGNQNPVSGKLLENLRQKILRHPSRFSYVAHHHDGSEGLPSQYQEAVDCVLTLTPELQTHPIKVKGSF